MVEYEGRFEMFSKDETIDIPADAVGITVGSFGGKWTVHYLVPPGGEE